MKKVSDDELLKAAKVALDRAYAPYSRFRVGAALPLDDGTIVSGCNVENASYGLTICAERSAIFAAVTAGAKIIRRIAVAVETPGQDLSTLMPCGACLQVMREFMPLDGRILIAGNREYELKDLLPYSFSLPTANPKDGSRR